MPTANFANRTLYRGDNLGFNEGRDFHATPDSLAAGAESQDQWSWDRDVHRDWIDAIQDDWPAVWELIEAFR